MIFVGHAFCSLRAPIYHIDLGVVHACVAIRVVQDNEDAVAFGLTFARILERVILGDTVPHAITSVQQLLHHGTGNPNDAFFAHGSGVLSLLAMPCLPPFVTARTL